MANSCYYEMIAASDKKENLERIFQIMKYKDPEYFIYRVMDVDCDDVKFDEENKLFSLKIYGDVAWSATKWVENEEGFDSVIKTSHYITLDRLCKILNVAIEIFTEEEGFGFQEHYVITKEGNVITSDCVDWNHEYYDDEGNELNEPIETGGFGDDYLNFYYPNELFYME